MTLLDELKRRARGLRAETFALALAARHPRTPWYAKWLVAAIVAYALSPIDLIPDFVPLLGYLDDLVLIPLGLALAIRLIDPAVLAECRARARSAMQEGKPVSRAAAVAIVAIWLAVAALAALWAY
ncbi:MAG TPA: YkvA family protein, partial [Burkholderiaceae bacterium]|nr:YkvA family protein [Burkholderiaceae bacterium]